VDAAARGSAALSVPIIDPAICPERSASDQMPPRIGVLVEDRIERFRTLCFARPPARNSCNDPSQQVLRTLRVPNNPDFASLSRLGAGMRAVL
jgi:hypothetical protein